MSLRTAFLSVFFVSIFVFSACDENSGEKNTSAILRCEDVMASLYQAHERCHTENLALSEEEAVNRCKANFRDAEDDNKNADACIALYETAVCDLIWEEANDQELSACLPFFRDEEAPQEDVSEEADTGVDEEQDLSGGEDGGLEDNDAMEDDEDGVEAVITVTSFQACQAVADKVCGKQNECHEGGSCPSGLRSWCERELNEGTVLQSALTTCLFDLQDESCSRYGFSAENGLSEAGALIEESCKEIFN